MDSYHDVLADFHLGDTRSVYNILEKKLDKCVAHATLSDLQLNANY